MAEPAPKPDDNVPPVVDPSGNEGDNPKTFTQEELDNAVKARLAKAEKSAEEKTKKAIADAIAEEKRQAKLSAEDRATEESKKKQQELENKERDIALRENRADAREALQEKNISTELVDLVIDVDADKQAENIEKLETAFTKAVEEGVAAKLAGKAPEDYSAGGSDKKNSDGVNKGGTTAF